MVYITLSFDYIRTILKNRLKHCLLRFCNGYIQKGITIKTTMKNGLVLNLLRQVFNMFCCRYSIVISERVFCTVTTVLNTVIE